jgi:hypothetical protein
VNRRGATAHTGAGAVVVALLTGLLGCETLPVQEVDRSDHGRFFPDVRAAVTLLRQPSGAWGRSDEAGMPQGIAGDWGREFAIALSVTGTSGSFYDLILVGLDARWRLVREMVATPSRDGPGRTTLVLDTLLGLGFQYLDLDLDDGAVTLSDSRFDAGVHFSMRGELRPGSLVGLFAGFEMYGGLGGDEALTGLFDAGLSFHVTEKAALRTGWRYVTHSFESGRVDFNLEVSGPFAGIALDF